MRTAIAALALVLLSETRFAAGQAAETSAPANDSQSASSTVTIEARRHLERQVSHFVSSVVVHYMYDSLVRWDTPICPLVAGLARERGEFLLARISQVATAAGAKLDGERCSPNFYVMVTPEPDRLLKVWFARDPSLYNRANGLGHMQEFMHSQQPIRSWYNAGFHSADGVPLAPGVLDVISSLSAGLEILSVPMSTSLTGTRLKYSAVQVLSSVIIVVDLNRTRELSVGQLADYVAMIGLAEIRPDGDTQGIPTILRLFHDDASPPQGLSDWDRALLYSLYHTSQASVMQSGAIKRSMVARIAP
ncbi:MAG TPA: hypothetical protein VMG11_07995 [Steroidobacteraceae bacterium]|nr:hypothetical protein [Steroidobacteraceae bacterium]